MTHPRADDVHPIHWLEHAGQRLGVVPSLGGGVAAWQCQGAARAADAAQAAEWLDLWRPWAGDSDRYTLASFPMVPWSNRIGQGGFEHDGVFHPVALNRAGEPYPIHGDGWLQAWRVVQPSPDTLEMHLESHHFQGNPYAYQAVQRFVLLDGGMDQTLTVTHIGPGSLPYGLGQHPWFLRTADTRLQTQVRGVWLSGADPMPTAHTTDFPAGWDPREGMPAIGVPMDNAYTGWSGQGRIDWPERQLSLTLTVPEVHDRGAQDGYSLVYRPPVSVNPAFCFEPVTHPIDAFHQPQQPGLRVLHTGQSLTLQAQWRFSVGG